MNIKKIAVIAGFILVVIGIAALLYFTFFRSSPPPPSTTTPPTTTPPISGTFPTPGEFVPPSSETPSSTTTFPEGQRPVPTTVKDAKGGPVQTVEIQHDRNLTVAPVPSSDAVVTFDFFDGKFYRLSPDGTQEALTDQQFLGADNISIAPQADKAIIEFYDGSNILYDFTNKTQVTLPKHWQSFSFSLPAIRSLSKVLPATLIVAGLLLPTMTDPQVNRLNILAIGAAWLMLTGHLLTKSLQPIEKV